MPKQIKVVKRTSVKKFQVELKDLGNNIVTGKRVRKTINKDDAYIKSLLAHKKTCNPKGGFMKGSNAGYDYYYDGKREELPLVQDSTKYDKDFIASDDDFSVSDDDSITSDDDSITSDDC